MKKGEIGLFDAMTPTEEHVSAAGLWGKYLSVFLFGQILRFDLSLWRENGRGVRSLTFPLSYGETGDSDVVQRLLDGAPQLSLTRGPHTRRPSHQDDDSSCE